MNGNEEQASEQKKQSRGVERRLYTPREAADMLGMSVGLLTEHAKSGSIGYVETGFGKQKTRRAFLKEDIDNFIAQNRVAKAEGEKEKPARHVSYGDLDELRRRRKKAKPRPASSRGLARG